ncbi:alpha-E domain-containing protein [Botrimarina sp.]|uniref:alpha-E domain-containing protein n=1 Tax=Botrimarina sp. TaxID=2795802 RepID=UPI0032EE5830
MLSRVAESIYWMSRYVERAENVARFIDVNDNLTLGEGVDLVEQWAPLVYTTGDQELFKELYGEPHRDAVLRFLAFDPRNPNSVLSCVSAARENARSVRESITTPMWEQINKFYLMVQQSAQTSRFITEPNQFCDMVKHASHTLVGATYTTMSHGEAWHFSRVGRLIERADKTSRIVDVQYFHLLPDVTDVGTSLDVVRWSALLRSASALTMYRRVHGRITPDRVADFLILDRDFPRSMRFCLMRVQESVCEITGSRPGTFRCHSEQLAGRLRSEMDYTSIDDVVQQGMHEYIDQFQQRLNQIGGGLHADFFTLERDVDTWRQSQTQRMLP